MNRYELAGEICRAVANARNERIGEAHRHSGDPLADMSPEDQRPWLDTADAVLAMNFTPGNRLRSLADDWDRYGTQLLDLEHRNEMRRAVAVELQVLADQLWAKCQPEGEPPDPTPAVPAGRIGSITRLHPIQRIKLGHGHNYWYVRYKIDGRWGDRHEGQFGEVFRCWCRVKLGQSPPTRLAPLRSTATWKH